MRVGDNVTIKVSNPLWVGHERYASNVIAESTSFTGTVLPSPVWVRDDQLCLSTGIAEFAFRVIAKADILKSSLQAPPVPELQTLWQIPGKHKGQVYIVNRDGNRWSCNCVGYGYRKTCSHVDTAKLQFNGQVPVAKSLNLKEEKKVKKSEKSALQLKQTGVSYMCKLKKTTSSSSHYERGQNMSKRNQAIEIMNANATAPMGDVVKLIAKKIGVTEANARSYYRWIVANGKAKGTVEKATKKAKVTKSKPELVNTKTLSEIEAIKAKNLATMREVSKRKEYKNVARPEKNTEVVSKSEMAKRKAAIDAFTSYQTDDLPSFASPEKITRDQLKSMI